MRLGYMKNSATKSKCLGQCKYPNFDILKFEY